MLNADAMWLPAVANGDEPRHADEPCLCLLAGDSRQALAEAASARCAGVEGDGAAAIGPPPHGRFRAAVVGADSAQLGRRLREFAAGRETAFAVTAERRANRGAERQLGAGAERGQGHRPRLAFVFPGHGSQWAGMGVDLMQRSRTFRASMERISAAIERETGWSATAQLRDTTAMTAALTRIDRVQPVLFAVEVALAELWISWGVVPDVVIGHSIGEAAAAVIAGALSIDDAAAVVCREAALLTRVAGRGGMLVVDLPADETEALIAGYGAAVGIAARNSVRSTVLAGTTEALRAIALELARRGVFNRPVRLEVAAHGAQMDPVLREFRAAIDGIRARSGRIPICSAVHARTVAGEELGADYWVQNLRQPVLFSPAIDTLLESGVDTFLEVSPHPILLPFIEQNAVARGRAAVAVGSLRRDKGEMLTMLWSLGNLYVAGVDAAWGAVPVGPWQRPGEAGRGEREDGRVADGEVATRGRDGAAPDLLESLRRLHPTDHAGLKQMLVDWVRAETATVLGVETAEVLPERTLESLGMDSVSALELRNRMEQGVGLKIPATVAWNYPTIAAVAGYLAERVAQQRPDRVPDLPASGDGPQRIDMSGLSAAEALEAELLELEASDARRPLRRPEQ